MDLYLDKKEIKKLRKLGLSDSQIEEYRQKKLIEKILDDNCGKISKELGRTIRFSEYGSNEYKLFLQTSNGRFVELLVSYKDVVCSYDVALRHISNDLKTRLYYL